MLDTLVNRAISDVWCSPSQDKQYIVRAARLSTRRGAIKQQLIMRDYITLPTFDVRYHVFQIGNIPPELMNLLSTTTGWKRISDIINETAMMAEVYFLNGIVLPRSDCWLQSDRYGNLLLAVKVQTRISGLEDESFYLRVYTNAYFNSSRVDAQTDRTYTESCVVTGLNDIITMQTKYNTAAALNGAVYAYLNGWLVQNFIPNKIQTGDVIEYVHDTSVRRVVDLPISELRTFESILDSKWKYLLSYAGDQTDDTIDYIDDIDVYILKNGSSGWYEGVHYGRHFDDSIRMLTHKDYSIPTGYVDFYQEQHSSKWSDVESLTVRLYIRKAGLDRPLIYENSRITELYKLSHDDIIDAMVGINATVDVWKAQNLENSNYPLLMRSKTNVFDAVTVQDMYGYNAISKMLGDTPQVVVVVENTERVVYLPPAYYTDSTVYEYDTDGVLLGYYAHTGGSRYVCTNVTATYVESIVGIAATGFDTIYATVADSPVTVDPQYNYRVYLGKLTYDVNSNVVLPTEWIDISSSELISVSNGQISFDGLAEDDYVAIMSDKQFVHKTIIFPVGNKTGYFIISAVETHDGISTTRTSTIPPRKLDVWLNKKLLIEHIDYVVNWPNLCVFNAIHLSAGGPSPINIRAIGFCNSEMEMESLEDYGFVEHGYLSNNWRYDIREDKVMSINIGGKLKMRDVVSFSEFNTGIAVAGFANGTPYAILENVVPIRDQEFVDTYELRRQASLIDDQISNYMTLKYPQPPLPPISPITEKYVLFSPFVSTIISKLQANALVDPNLLKQHYSNASISAWVEPYKYLLNFDPAFIGFDERYVVVRPAKTETVQLDIYNYTFVKRLIDMFLNGKVPLTPFIQISLPA